VIALLAIAVGCLALSVVCMVVAFRLLSEHREEEKADHAKCLALIAGFVGDEFAARVLDSAAADYNTMDGQAEVARIRNTVWGEGDEPVPTLWLRERASTMHGRVDA
jgi:hypothetical protein